MPLHILKLCVGAESFEDQQSWIAERVALAAAKGVGGEHGHTTRMFPKRKDEIVAGGSLYWVIKGSVQARQLILDLVPVVGEDGIRRCKIVLEPRLIATQWQPRRAFQGWRYLKPEDAPRDLHEDEFAAVPPELRRELGELGLL